MDKVCIKSSNIFKRVLCLFLVLLSIIFFVPKPRAKAIAGFDDAILFGILQQAVFSAAGANTIVGVNGVASNELNPVSEDGFIDIITGSSMTHDFYEVTGMYFDEFVDSIDWDNVFTVASGTSKLIVNLPKTAVDMLVSVVKHTINELGATSDTSVDWSSDTGNICNVDDINLSGFAPRVVTSDSPILMNYGGENLSWLCTSESTVYGGVLNGGDTWDAYCYFFSDSPLTNAGYFDMWPTQSNSGYYIAVGGQWEKRRFLEPAVGNVNDFIALFAQSEVEFTADNLTMTLVPDSDTEAMVYPETAVEDYPNVESIPYYTDIPYTGTIPDTGVIPYTEAIPYLQEAVQSNTLTASLEATQEGVIEGITDGSVTIPLFNITLPDFQFNFSGIWYYVVQWVNSIGAWMSQMFTVWGILPAPMIYPVWATAVIVIILGVYKRFFM